MIKWYSRRSYCTASASYKPAGCLKNAAGIKKKSGVKGKCHPAFQKGSVLKWPQTAQFHSLYLIPVLCILFCCSPARGWWWSGEKAEGMLEFLTIFTSPVQRLTRNSSPLDRHKGGSSQGLAGSSIWAVINYTNIRVKTFFFVVRSLLSYFIDSSWWLY